MTSLTSSYAARIALVVLVASIGNQASRCFAQGGGNANATGIALENAVQNAAQPNAAPPMAEDGYADPDYESMTDDGSGYGAPPSLGGSSDQWNRSSVAASAMGRQVAQSLAGLLNAVPADAVANKRPLTLWEQAALAFYQGDQTRALALFHAHLVADGDEAAAARSSVKYSRLLKRPVWAVRFGLSILPRVPSEFAGDPQPLRKDTKIASPTGRGRGLAPTADGGENGGSFDGGEEMQDDLQPDQFGGTRGNANQVVTTFGGAGGEEAAQAVDRNLGLVGDVFKSLFSAQLSAGKFGNALDGMEAKGATLSATHQDAISGLSNDPMWIPGVNFLGEGPSSEMLLKAKAGGIDVLLHFDVIVKANRIGPPQYTTRCSVLHVESGTTLGVSKAIDKYEIASKAASNETTVRELLAPLFEILDKKVSVEPMPPLTPLHATSRIDSLLGSKERNSLRSLAEMTMFHSQRLITPEQLDKAFFYAGGDIALQLLHDEETARYQKVAEFVEKELSSASAN
jgi:hypothetical protein